VLGGPVTTLGLEVGLLVGPSLGAFDGIQEGIEVGENVGGTVVGVSEVVGLSDGNIDGINEVGEMDGFLVVLKVGP